MPYVSYGSRSLGPVTLKSLSSQALIFTGGEWIVLGAELTQMIKEALTEVGLGNIVEGVTVTVEKSMASKTIGIVTLEVKFPMPKQ